MVIKIKGFRFSDNRYFSLSIILFLTYCLIPKVRSFSLYVIQIPIVIVSYVMLLLAVNARRGNKATIDLFLLSVLIVLFNYVFLQGLSSSLNIITTIGIAFSLFVVAFPLMYLYSRELDFVDSDTLYYLIVLLMAITCITTIIGTYQYPSPCRQVSGNNNAVLNSLYTSKNIGGYRFVYSLLLCIPYIVKRIRIKKSLFDLILLALFSFCIIRSDFTTAIMLWIIVLAFSIALKKGNTISLLLIGLVAIMLLVVWDDILSYIASKSTSNMLNHRINSLLLYSRGGYADGDLAIRQDLYTNSLNAFLQNPIFGDFFKSSRSAGGHSQILDFLANFGLIGALILIAIIRRISKWPSIKNIERDKYRSLQVVLAVVIATLNTFLAPEMLFSILVFPMLIHSVEMESQAI